MGYEGLAETIVSAMLEKSTVKYPFVVYEYSQIKYKDRVYSGCKKRCIFSRMAMTLFHWKSCIENLPAGALQVDTRIKGK